MGVTLEAEEVMVPVLRTSKVGDTGSDCSFGIEQSVCTDCLEDSIVGGDWLFGGHDGENNIFNLTDLLRTVNPITKLVMVGAAKFMKHGRGECSYRLSIFSFIPC